MVDPTEAESLVQIEVYGEELYRQLYGELLPVPADRVVLAEDGLRLQLGARTVEFIDAPGHAQHHHCPIDLDQREVYSGDNFGICYRDLDAAGSCCQRRLRCSSNRMRCTARSTGSFRTTRGEFSRRTSARSRTSSVLRVTCTRASTQSWSLARLHAAATDRTRRIAADMFDYFNRRLDAHGYRAAWPRGMRSIDDDVMLNTQGLDVWLKRQQ